MLRSARLLSLGVAGAIALAIPGCGIGPGAGVGGLHILVTHDFGSRTVASLAGVSDPGQDTVMRTLERHFEVSTRYGGGFVQSIEGLAGSADHRDWFYYLDGREAEVGATQTAVHRGEQIWWDLHDWSASLSIPAVVGQFPAPFSAGAHLACSVPCPGVRATLASAHVRLGTATSRGLPELSVGPPADPAAAGARRLLGAGPASSGVYAMFTSHAIELLTPRGRVAARLGPGAGLIAATVVGGRIVWLLDGIGPAGLRAAERAFTPANLSGRFSVAVAPGGRVVPLPVDPAS